MHSLKKNTDLAILPADKDSATVILNTVDYKQKIMSLLEDTSYKNLTRDPTESTERKTALLLKKSKLTEDICKQLRPTGCRPPRLYGRPNIHKEGVPLRLSQQHWRSNLPIRLFQQLVGKSEHHVTNSLQFVQTLDSTHIQPDDLMVSFDVVSLFTRVPVADSLKLLRHHFEDGVLALFQHVLTSTYFCFDGKFYEQTDGVAMGSPFSPVIDNFFLEIFEKRAVEQAPHKPMCWFRNIDDTFVIWPHGKQKHGEFLNHLNGIHKNIQFSMETVEQGHLPFLDIDI